jgi:hypothetical protein
MKKLLQSFLPAVLLLLFLTHAEAQQIFETKFGVIDNWTMAGTATGYNAKSYDEGGWKFHSTIAVRGASDEGYGGSPYSFRDRGVFTIKNTEAVSGITGFSLQLRDWMIAPEVPRIIRVSYDSGATWKALDTIIKAKFNAYQVYQNFEYTFDDDAGDFTSEQLQIEISDGGNVNNGRINIGQFIALGASDATAIPVFNPAGGDYYSPVEVTITSATENATVYYSTTSDEGPWTEYENPVSVTTTTTIWAYATSPDHDDSMVANAIYNFPEVTEVASIEALRQVGVLTGTVYRITGEVFMSFKNTSRNQKFFQDALEGGAGIKIDDVAGNLTTPLNTGDGVRNLTGTLNNFNRMLQFIPVANASPLEASSTGNTIIPDTITLAELIDADNFFTIGNIRFSKFQGRLILVENLVFNKTGNFNSAESFGEVAVSDPSATLAAITASDDKVLFRVEYTTLDYNNTPIPQQPVNLTAVVDQRNEYVRIFARSLDDIEVVPVSVVATTASNLLLYPNPTRGNITMRSDSFIHRIEVSDITGKVIQRFHVQDSNFHTELNLSQGIYILQIHTDEGVTVRKLQVR